MTGIEIMLLVAGTAIFIASFFLPDNANEDSSSATINQEDVRKIIEEELSKIIDQAEGRMEDISSYIVERTEVALDKLANEKMLAINEYSDTVIEAIDRNHQEVLFMYDMLNNKSVDVKNTLREVDRVEKERKDISYSIQEVQNELYDSQVPTYEESEYYESENRELDFRPIGVKPQIADEVVSELLKEEPEYEEEIPAPKSKPAKKGRSKLVKTVEQKVEEQKDSQVITGNRNERILALHREGRSNVEIARELGLGMGEVKLVIDLFEGKR